MSRRLGVAAALACLLGAAGLAAATPAGEGDVDLEVEGRALALAYEPGADGGPGDDAVVVEQGLEHVGVAWEGAPLGISVVASGAGFGLRHDAASAAIASYDAYLAGAPVHPYAGEDGVDFGLRTGLVDRTAGEEPLSWPSDWYGLGWGLSYDRAEAPTSVAGSTDAFLGYQAKNLARMCADVERRLHFRPAACDIPAGDALLPDLRVGAAVPAVAVTAEPMDGELPLSFTTTSVGVAEAEGATSEVAPATHDEPAPAGLLDEVLALFGLTPARAVPGVSYGPASTQQSTLVALNPAVALPLALAALAAPLLAWALYRRILPSRALQHPVREDLVRRVRAHPGIHESQLAREMGLRHTHVQYHLRVLSEAGVLETRKFGGLKCIFELGRLSTVEKAAAMTERGRSREVLENVGADPGVAQRDLARKLAMSESSVKWHLDRLEQAGLVRTERARGAKRAWVQPGALATPPPPAEEVAAVPRPPTLHAPPATL